VSEPCSLTKLPSEQSMAVNRAALVRFASSHVTVYSYAGRQHDGTDGSFDR